MDIQPMAGGGSVGAGPSMVQFKREVDYRWPVTDFADAMFNSRNSNNNNKELIFSSTEEKSKTGERKT